MQVNLKKNWFARNAALYERSKNPHTFPEDWRDNLPEGAVVLEEVKPAEEEPAGGEEPAGKVKK